MSAPKAGPDPVRPPWGSSKGAEPHLPESAPRPPTYVVRPPRGMSKVAEPHLLMSPRTARRRALLAIGATVAAPWVVAARPARPYTVAAGPDRYNTDPQRFTFTVRAPHAQIAETGVSPDVRFLPAPLLFERWSVRQGQYQVLLREGLRFHDGTSLDSETAIAALRLFSESRSDFLQIDPASLRRVDARRLAFASRTGSNLVIENMSHRATSLFSPNSDRRVAPAGTGPWRFVRYQPRRALELAADPHHWGRRQGLPAPAHERMVFRFVPDAQARLLALAAGEVDVVAEVTPQMLQAITPRMPVRVHVSRPVSSLALLVNLHRRPPHDRLADVRVRRALALAIDRAAVARVLYGGHAVAARGLLPDWMFGLGTHLRGHDHDRSEAGRLLDAAGWRLDRHGLRQRGGEPLRLRLVAGFPNLSAVAPFPELLQQMLRALGVGLDIVAVDDDELYRQRFLEPGDGDLFVELAGNTTLDPTFLLHHLFDSRTPWRAYRHMAAGAVFEAAIDTARQSDNPAARLDAVRRAHRIVVEEVLAAIPVLHVPQFVLARPGWTVPMHEHRDWIDYGAVRPDAPASASGSAAPRV